MWVFLYEMRYEIKFLFSFLYGFPSRYFCRRFREISFVDSHCQYVWRRKLLPHFYDAFLRGTSWYDVYDVCAYYPRAESGICSQEYHIDS